MSTADKLREVYMALQIHKRLEKDEMLVVVGSLIDMAERLEKLDRGLDRKG